MKAKKVKLLTEKNSFVFCLIPAFLMIGFVAIYPLGYELYLSLRSYNLLRPWYAREWVGLRNYLDILGDPNVWHSLKLTLYFVGAAVGIEFVLGLGIALLFNRQLKGMNIFRTLIILPMAITPVAVALIWRYLVHDTFGVITYLFEQLGWSFGWYGEVATAIPTVIIIDIWQWTPFVFLILLAGLLALPREPIESAKIDGASNFQIFVYITMPLMKPIIAIGILLRLVDALKIFDIIWVLTKGGPGHATEVYNIFIYLQGFRYYNMGYAGALGILLFVGVLAIAVGFMKAIKLEV